MLGSHRTNHKPGALNGVTTQPRPWGHRLIIAVTTLAAGALMLGIVRSPLSAFGPMPGEKPGMERQRNDAGRIRATGNWQPGPLLDHSLPLPTHHEVTTGELLLIQQIARLAPREPKFETVTVRSGDSVSGIFKRAGLSPQEVYRMINADQRVQALTRIYPGDKIRFRLTEDNKLEALRYELNQTSTLLVTREGDDFKVDVEEKALEKRVLHATGVIDRSFFLAGRQAGLSHGQLMQFMSMFEWQVDFNRDIRAGDAFSVLYEAHFLNGARVRDGRILAAKLINRGQQMNALHFELPDGTTGYFDPDGNNLRKTFLRRPIQQARISSNFSRNRQHPVLGISRPHLGTDFAAPTGTPIMAAGAGRVIHLGRKGGYGNTIIIQHGNQYRTLYAHMSRYKEGLHEGSRVEQGQIIGYVGRSGLVSGPHLHYEFMVNGSHFNPMTVNLPNGDPIPEQLMADFRAATTGHIAALQSATQTELAMHDDD